MTLRDICEPFFQAIALLVRVDAGGDVAAMGRRQQSAGADGSRDGSLRERVVAALGTLDSTRAFLVSLLDECYEKALQTGGIVALDYTGDGSIEGIEQALAFLGDDVIMHSNLPWKGGWRDAQLLAQIPRIQKKDGQTRFFRMLTSELTRPADVASARLEVLLGCLSLGFCGIHRHVDPEQPGASGPPLLRSHAQGIVKRLDPSQVASTMKDPICPEAYERFPERVKADRKPWNPPQTERRLAATVVLVMLLITLLTLYFVFLSRGLSQLNGYFEKILAS
ncbi:MAG: DotU family type IV/VI secretion system protein [Verrucomicrobiales bacterium]|nr:DotU family type IV/VI secretion system protein [Verrucomicrobiales bacterium]